MRFFRIYGLSILSSLGVFYLSILRNVSPLHIPVIPHFDKIAHFGLYLVLAAVICYELYRQRYQFSEKIMWIVLSDSLWWVNGTFTGVLFPSEDR